MFDDTARVRVCDWRASQQAGIQGRIRQLQQSRESTLLGQVGICEALCQIVLEQRIELAHAAPALPRQPTRVQCLLPASIFLISAIAFAGFKSFGHASVQFMIVWQR